MGATLTIVNAGEAVTIQLGETGMAERRDWIRAVLVVALLMLGFGLKGALIAPPSPPLSVSPGEFDTTRAIARLQRILGDQRPHPVDTAANSLKCTKRSIAAHFRRPASSAVRASAT